MAIPLCGGCGASLGRDPWALEDPSSWYCPTCRTRTVIHAPPEPPPVLGEAAGANRPEPPVAGRPVTMGEVIAAAIEDPTAMPIFSEPGGGPPVDGQEGRGGRGRRLPTSGPPGGEDEP